MIGQFFINIQIRLPSQDRSSRFANGSTLADGKAIFNALKSMLSNQCSQINTHFGNLAQQFNFTYRYIDDVLSLNNTKFAEYLEFITVYTCELEIKETTETAAASSYLDCYLYMDNGKLTTRLYDKRDDFNFPIVNFPFLSSNIPYAPAYGVYISQLMLC